MMREGVERVGKEIKQIASPASIQHVGHECHRVHTPNNVHHIDHHSGEGGGQCLRDDGARGRPCEHLNLTRSVKYHISTRVQRLSHVMKFIVTRPFPLWVGSQDKTVFSMSSSENI